MKYLKDFELFEGGDPERKAAIRQKIRDLEIKDREKVAKKGEEANIWAKCNGAYSWRAKPC